MEAATTVADRIAHVAAALRSHNIEAIVVETGAEAKDVVLGLIPDGAEVHSGKSKTLEDIGLYAELVESGRYDALRPRLSAMDRATQGDEMRKLVAAPAFMLGSVAAIAADGTLVAASATGSQLGAYVSGAGRLILVVGSQKLLRTSTPRCVASTRSSFPGRTTGFASDSASIPRSRRSSSSSVSGRPAGPRSCSSASRSASDGGRGPTEESSRRTVEAKAASGAPERAHMKVRERGAEVPTQAWAVPRDAGVTVTTSWGRRPWCGVGSSP